MSHRKQPTACDNCDTLQAAARDLRGQNRRTLKALDETEDRLRAVEWALGLALRDKERLVAKIERGVA